ncbi:MAG: sulfurtransferase [Proteobacteria bacterium]|nr:sulfurtransferase [Pseudomonadota bacterium]
MSLRTLVDVPTLATLLAGPAPRIVDCRFDLGDPDAGAALYRRGHVPGAVYAHLDADLSGPRAPWTGRHPLPEPEAFAATLGRLGIGPDTPVVAYDDSGGIYAARLWWLLRWVGHDAVAVLDGGLAAWRAAGQTLAIGPVSVEPATFRARPDESRHVSADELAGLLARGECLLLDARSAERFEGRVEPLDPRAGHVPGALNHHYASNLGSDGRFLPAATLRSRFEAVLGGRAPRAVVSMCGSGVTACHTLLALELAGLPGARLYAGSWSEWCRDAARPVATGP